MLYVSIDLSQRSTGITICKEEGDILSTFTIKDLIENKYREGDIEQIRQAAYKLTNSIFEEATLKSFDFNFTFLIEYNINPMNVRFEKFSLSLIFYFAAINNAVGNTIPIQANRWMSIADSLFRIKRDKYDNNKAGNKKWISDLCKHLAPNHKFKTQDEKDSFLMLKTYLEKPNRF